MTKLQDLISDTERAAVRAPIEQARTLPRRAFLSDRFYQFEVEHVLQPSWMAVVFSSQLPNAGDVFPVTALDCPMLFTRDDGGNVHAFHNVVPYDSSEVCIEARHNCKTIITPYHGWEYGLDGKLLAANYWDGTAGAASLHLGDMKADLILIPCEEWFGTLFVYLGDQVTDFYADNRAVLEHFKDLDLNRLTIGLDGDGAPSIRHLPIGSNWKTVYENYAPNVYHESFVHAIYRKSPHSPRVDGGRNKTYTEINDPSGFLGLCYDNSIAASFYGESELPPLCMKDGSPNITNTISNMFPNWVTTVLGNVARIAFFLPDGPESGTQHLATFFDVDAADKDAFVKERERSVRVGVIAREEDNRICESIQRARHSPALNAQFYSPFWDAMHYTLSNLVLDRLERSEASD